jgi:hypothetical protein
MLARRIGKFEIVICVLDTPVGKWRTLPLPPAERTHAFENKVMITMVEVILHLHQFWTRGRLGAMRLLDDAFYCSRIAR